MNEDALDQATKDRLRREVVDAAMKLLGVPYERGAEWTDYSIIPKTVDCSEKIEGVFVPRGLKMPDGSQNQYNFLSAFPVAGKPRPGDVGFFGRGKRPTEIYHSGLVGYDGMVIEARAFDPKAKFETGKVILRPVEKWENFERFIGWYSHPKLA